MNPIHLFLNIFSISSNRSKKTKKEVHCSILRTVIVAIILGAVNIFTIYYKIRYVYSMLNISISLTDTVQMIYDYIQYIADIYFVNVYGGQICAEYHQQYERIDGILHTRHNPVIERTVAKLFGIFAIIWLTSSLCDYIAWYNNAGWQIPLLFAIAYVFMLIKILTMLDLTTQVINIQFRLKVMGDLVQDYCNSTEVLPQSNSLENLLGDCVGNKNWFYSGGCNRIAKWQRNTNPLKNLARHGSHEMRWLTRCYLILVEQCVFINKMYGIRILLNSLSLLIDMIRYSNIAVRIVLGTGTQNAIFGSSYFPAVSSISRALACAAVLTSLVFHCEQAYCEQKRIGNIIDHLLVNKNPSEELQTAASELRALTEARPISFNMAGFFQLNYSVLLSIASVVVTYTIILLQSSK